jgi:preprotein translocase subunit YajC
LGQLIVLVAMFALLWLFLIRPQRRRAQAHRDLLTKVEIGDEILTVGGLIGRVRSAQDEELVLEIAPGTNVRVARRSVASVLSPGLEARQVEAAPAAVQDEEVHS